MRFALYVVIVMAVRDDVGFGDSVSTMPSDRAEMDQVRYVMVNHLVHQGDDMGLYDGGATTRCASWLRAI